LEALAKWYEQDQWWFHLCWFVPLSIGWEVAEIFLERRFPDKWRGKIEHWSNKWIGDQISNGLGSLLGIWIVGQ